MFIPKSYRGFPASYWVLLTGTFINRLGSFVIPFFAIYLTQSRGYRVEQAGLIVSLFGVGSFGAGPLGGYLSDRIGRRAVLVTSLCIGASAVLFMGFSSTSTQVGAGALILGLFGEMYRPAVSAVIADIIRPTDRPRAYGLVYWAINLGFSVATIVAGLIASRNFQALFVADAATTLVFAALVWRLIPETRPKIDSTDTIRFSTPLRDGLFLRYVGLNLLVALVFMQFTVAMPVDMHSHGISAKQYGFLISLNGILIVLFQPVIVRIADKLRASRALALSCLLLAVGFGLNGLIGSVPFYAVAIAIWTLGEMFGSSVAPSIVASRAPVRLRGSYQGILQMAWGAAAFLAPTLGSFLLGRFPPIVLWLGCFTCGLAAAAGHLIVTARLETAE